jgi:hypothetical protein
MEGSIIVYTPDRFYEVEGGGIESDRYWGEVFAVGGGGWGLLRFFCKATYLTVNHVRYEPIGPNDPINKPLVTVRRRRVGQGGFTIYGRQEFQEFPVALQVPVDELEDELVEAYGLNTENRLAVERQLYQHVRERRQEREQNAEHHRPIRGFAFLDTDDTT